MIINSSERVRRSAEEAVTTTNEFDIGRVEMKEYIMSIVDVFSLCGL